MRKNLTKIALIAMSVVILGLAIAVGTLAYLKDTTESIKNVFVVGANIDITLTESKGFEIINDNGTPEDDGDDFAEPNTKGFKVVPGAELAKDPTITVLGGSEACYVFVKVETNLINKVGEATPDQYDAIWSINSAWTAVPGVAGVYYIEQDSLVGEDDVAYAVLTDNKVTVSTKGIPVKDANSDTIADEVYMTFTGYAIQSDALTGLGEVPADPGDGSKDAEIAAAKAANAKIAWDLLQADLA